MRISRQNLFGDILHAVRAVMAYRVLIIGGICQSLHAFSVGNKSFFLQSGEDFSSSFAKLSGYQPTARAWSERTLSVPGWCWLEKNIIFWFFF